MLLKLLLLFTIVPLVEFFLLYQLSVLTGSIWVTITVVLLTGITGAALAKRQGLKTLDAIRKDLGAGIIPGDKILDGLIILLSAALLVTPGVLTDAVGLAMLIPPLRRPVRRMIQRRLRKKIEDGKVAFYRSAGFGPVRDTTAEEKKEVHDGLPRGEG